VRPSLVREQQGDVVARFEDLDCFVSIDRLDRLEAGVFHDVHRTHPEDHLVFNN
jgi:hypothetical protein